MSHDASEAQPAFPEYVDHYVEARRELLGAEIARRQLFDGDPGGVSTLLALTIQNSLAAAHVHALLAQVQVHEGTRQ